MGRKCIGLIEARGLAAALSVEKIHGSFAIVNMLVQKSALDESVYNKLIHNAQTVGDPLQIASGKRPQGTSRQAKWVGHWEQKGAYIRE